MNSRATRRLLALVLLTLVSHPARAMAPDGRPRPTPSSARLELALRRLQVVGSALYIGAHPDDENTALLAWLAQGRLVRTAYLSLTRGDGGQNLIGTEKGDRLGVLRTQELLEARRVDGAEQYFTRAIDFGYTRSAEEALEIWSAEAVLGDVVRVIRTFRPDILITRFPGDGRGRHGQHTASARLARQAFAAAADPSRFPDQLATLEPWQARRLFWNDWERTEAEAPARLSIDLGAYNPVLGRSYSEIAAASRSMHKSQGFGAAPRRGSRLDTLELQLGAPAVADPFEGIDLSWRRIEGGEPVGAALERAAQAYRPEAPWEAAPALLEAYQELGEIPAEPWVAVKRQEIAEVLRDVTGLWMELAAPSPTVTPGERIRLEARLVNRSPVPITARRLQLPGGPDLDLGAALLEANRPRSFAAEIALPEAVPVSQPYWLTGDPAGGLYRVRDPALIGSPQSPPPVVARLALEMDGVTLTYRLPAFFRWTDPVKGERLRRLVVAPPVSLHFEDPVVLFPDARAGEIEIVARAARAPIRGVVRLEAPPGWTVRPAERGVTLAAPGEERTLRFTVTPPATPASGRLTARVEVEGRSYRRDAVLIDHPHITPQALFPVAAARVVRLELAHRGTRVGYIMGAGDEIPEALRRVGYDVRLLTDEELEHGDLDAFDALVTGVRAYNTRRRLAQLNRRLLGYVERGGTLVVQYNTSFNRVLEALGPYPLTLSRQRVTREDAPVTLLAPDHPLLAGPNRITGEDFEGWVQERGLYFPAAWDAAYQALLACHDPGEEPLAGGLLAARYGRGWYIYTGYSFFRQLPAGVAGAYRLFVNLISAGGDRVEDPVGP